eukprot:8055113-Karenia_brevis.AAC.1
MGQFREVKLLEKVPGPTGTKLICEETHEDGRVEKRQYWNTGATELVYPDTSVQGVGDSVAGGVLVTAPG